MAKINKLTNSKSGEEMEPEKKNLSRRSFFGQCGRCAAWLASGLILKKDLNSSSPFVLTDLASNSKKENVKLGLLFALHRLKQDRPDWPNLGFDFRPIIEKYTNVLHQKFPHYTFLVSLVSGPEEAEKIIRANAEQDVDGYAVFQRNCWNQVVQPAVATVQPAL